MPLPLARTLIVAGLSAILAAPSARDGRADEPVAGSTARVDAAALPRYERRLLLETTAETSANVSLGDLDGDGHLDIVLAKGRHWPLVDRVLFGDGRGGIRAAHDLGVTADRSYSGRLADLDGDGTLDVVISNDAPDPKLVYLNDGRGRFRVGSTYGRADWETRNASVADLDGDRLPDIIVANRSDRGANYVCLNRGGGRFDADCTAFSSYPATTITPADFDRDGVVDLAVPHRDGGQSYVYLGGPKAAFPESRRVPFGPPDASIRMAEAADFDGDGCLDLAAVDDRSGVALYLGKRTGGFLTAAPIGDRGKTPYALAASDLDGDGAIDLVVGHIEAQSTAYFNRGSGRRFTAVHFGDAQGAVYGFAIGDLDRDGLPEIAAARSGAPNVVYFAARAAPLTPASGSPPR
jgi:hypothetical protein